MVEFVRERLPEVRALCQRYGARELQRFGSALGDEFDLVRSDVDLVVEMPESDTAGYYALHDALESLFGRKVDLLEKAVGNPYLVRAIKAHREFLFAA